MSEKRGRKCPAEPDERPLVVGKKKSRGVRIKKQGCHYEGKEGLPAKMAKGVSKVWKEQIFPTSGAAVQQSGERGNRGEGSGRRSFKGGEGGLTQEERG